MATVRTQEMTDADTPDSKRQRTDAGNNLQSLRFSNENGVPKLSVLDQLLIPHVKVYIDLPDVESAWAVIRSMQIRGAPLIAMVACLGLCVDLSTNPKTISELNAISADDSGAVLSYIQKKTDYLRTSRPTAVNLFNALDELTTALKDAASATSNGGSNGKSARERIVDAVTTHAEMMLRRDVADNRAIGIHGADALLKEFDSDDGVRMVTICNTGSLATAGHGTALGVARELQARGRLSSITALETRPYNQGSRLTAFEIVEERMPGGRLICDSSAGALMKMHGVDACVVGADRVCANGDTANKIGTYNLALVAAAHNVPFYIASPFTTLDTKHNTGDDIEIEERPATELIESSRAPKDIDCWNPAFDVTPAKYIAAIITEKGVIEKEDDGNFDVAAFVQKHAPDAYPKPKLIRRTSSLEMPTGYTEHTAETLPRYLAHHAPKVMEALDASSFVDLDCVETGDDLNLVFVVTNTFNKRKVVVKQALPYVRSVGESWPLSLDRAFYEYRALQVEKDACPEFVPEVYFFSKRNGLMAREFIPPPSITLRKGLMSGTQFPTMAADMGTFCAKTLFKTSGFKLSATELRKSVQFWSKNSAMCAVTEQVVFTEPYISSPNNKWTSPHLDGDKKAIENDTRLKLAASTLKSKFVTQTEALLHADLHAGSVMCTPEPGNTYVVNPEFGFYGPMGFDVGAFIAGLFLAYVSQGGHNNGEDYADWILLQVIAFWKTFQSEFMNLWNDPLEHTGMKYQRHLLEDKTAVRIAQQEFMENLLEESLSFAGMKMLRRIVGTAHTEKLESIKDIDVKARCEKHGLEIAKEFVKGSAFIKSIDAAVQVARDKKPTS